MPKQVNVRREEAHGKVRYYATVDSGPEFFVGREVAYPAGGPNRGLTNWPISAGVNYDPADYRGAYGFWADFIYPTSQCESGGYFHCLNTYDRAFFTFGFLQYAAHEPGGDFVHYVRALLETPQAAEYFPALTLKENSVYASTAAGLVRLENSQTTRGLMEYLNPTRGQVEAAEVENAARFIHWCESFDSHRDIQVRVGVDLFARKMREYSRWYGLDGAPDTVCLVIADIHHQGRGTRADVSAALNTGGDPEASYRNLLRIGADEYTERVKTLRQSVDQLRAKGVLGGRRYSESRGEFVPVEEFVGFGSVRQRVPGNGAESTTFPEFAEAGQFVAPQALPPEKFLRTAGSLSHSRGGTLSAVDLQGSGGGVLRVLSGPAGRWRDVPFNEVESVRPVGLNPSDDGTALAFISFRRSPGNGPESTQGGGNGAGIRVRLAEESVAAVLAGEALFDLDATRTAEFAWPTLPIDADGLIEFLEECRAAGVQYGLGKKVPFHDAKPGKDFTRVDCSGFVREAIWRATTPHFNFKDGSVVQREWVEQKGFRKCATEDCALPDGIVRIAFLSPMESGNRIGHVVLTHMGFTIESHGGKGPDRREWTGSGWQAKTHVYVLTAPAG